MFSMSEFKRECMIFRSPKGSMTVYGVISKQARKREPRPYLEVSKEPVKVFMSIQQVGAPKRNQLPTFTVAASLHGHSS